MRPLSLSSITAVVPCATNGTSPTESHSNNSDNSNSSNNRNNRKNSNAGRNNVSNSTNDSTAATSTGQKRPAGWDTSNSNDRAIKRRSSKACLSCRNRKVRCDVIVNGQPCTNCRLDSFECVVKEPNRGRRPGSTAAATAAARAAAAASKSHVPETNDSNNQLEPQSAGSKGTSDGVNETAAPSSSSITSTTSTTSVAVSGIAALSAPPSSMDTNRTSTTPVSLNNDDPSASGNCFDARLEPSSPLQNKVSPNSRRPRSPSTSRPTGADDLLVTLTFDNQELNRNTPPDQPEDDVYTLHHSPRSQHDATNLGHHGGVMYSEIAESMSTTRSSQSTQSELSAKMNYSARGTPSTASGAGPGLSAAANLPSWVRPLPEHIGPRDLDYLADKGALTIVNDRFRDALLRIYADHVFPFMPAINLDAFLGAITQDPENSRYPPVSLLLFQAIMFVSVTFADPKMLREHGFESPREARKVFFGRVRLLYGMDCETDRRALLSSVLLMTYWYDTPDDGKDTWYWMGIALTLAQVDGLHRNPQNLKMSTAEKKLRKRQWWSCVMRDRLMALGIRRPTRIRDDEFDVPALSLDDFDIDPTEDPLRNLTSGSTPNGENGFNDVDLDPVLANQASPSSPDARRSLAIMAIELSHLCVCIGHILRSQYTVMGDHPVGSEYLLKAFVVPKRSEEQASEMARCDTDLQEWLRKQDEGSRYIPGSLSTTAPNFASQRVVRLHQAMIHLIYLTAESVLHRPQAVRPDTDNNRMSVDNSDSGDVERQRQQRNVSRERVTDAAIGITKIAFDLQSSKQLRFMSTSSIPAFLSASLIHLMDIRSSNEEVRNISIGRFYQCVQALQELQDMYASAVYGLRFIITVLQNTDIRVPMFQGTMLRSLLGSVHTNITGVSSAANTVAVSRASRHKDTDLAGRRISTASSTAVEPAIRHFDTNFVSSFGRFGCNYQGFGTTSIGENVLIEDSAIAGTGDGSIGITQPHQNHHQHQHTSPLLAPYSQWDAPQAQLGGTMVQQTDLLASPYLANWAEIDGLVPGMMSFDPDPGALINGVMGLT